MTMNSIDDGRVQIEDELRTVKTQSKLIDPEVEFSLNVIEELNKIAQGVDSEMHRVEVEGHHRRQELELERKKWEIGIQ
jgi:hypothetical protein